MIFIHSVRAGAFTLQLSTALAATETVVRMDAVAPEGEDEIADQQEVADVVEREDAEDDIIDGTDCHKATQIEEGIERGEMVAHIV